jgi:parallel beta-helix repeat protein
MKKIVFLAFVLWLLSTAVVVRFVGPVVAGGTIYIRPDGSVDPSTAPIRRDGNVYTFTGNIYDEIVVERDNIVVDGASYTLQGTGSGTGIYLFRMSNVAIQNMQIRLFENGIYLDGSSGNNIYGNTITNNDRGIYLRGSRANKIRGNNIYGNTITNNDRGIHLYRGLENSFYHNSFIDNTEQVYLQDTDENFWDDGYLSGGNYWSDYTGVDNFSGPYQNETGSDGIGDTEYLIDSMNRDRYPFMFDVVPPLISIISPENKTYTVNNVSLSFAVTETTDWMGYSLDGQTNSTITGDTILKGLSEGIHTITVYANDTAGNMGHSNIVYFAVDTVAPKIEIVSPENKTYTTDSVSLSFTVNEETSWIGYSLDGQTNSTITGDTILKGLSEGTHTIAVYANDTAGNMGSSGTVYFSVDTTLPIITILSPENRTYDTTVVPLSFTVDEQVSWMAYSLDGKANETITGNELLTLSDGVHYVVVYANDTAGNMGASNTVYFTVDTEAPIIMTLSPENKTYTVNNVPLTFTVTETTAWMSYSLDGQTNQTVSGNTTLLGLSDGVHYITVYTIDIAGNMGHSDTVYFTIDTVLPNIEVLSPENKTYAVADVPLSFTVSEATAWMGYSLDGQTNVTVGGNTTLVGLSDGVHTITVYAEDTAGNMGASNTVYFTVDTEAPSILLVSPTNTSYASTSVPLRFVVYGPTSWRGYSLDGQTNVTVSGNTTLVDLSDGLHYITVYANDTAGNMGSSDTVYFTVDTVLPLIEVLSPKNKTYAVADVPLSFTVSEATAWMGYSLDGQTNVTVSGNTTLAGLSEGIHAITVYAEDATGNMGSSVTVYFAVDTTLPSIIILSPENKTYAENVVPLSFTVDKAVLWLGYSLDGQAHVTVTGNTTLAGLVDGVHYVVVYANNTAGKMGASDTVYFTVDTEAPIIIILSPKNETYASTSLSLNFTQSEPTSWMGYSLDDQMNVTVSGNTTLVDLSDGLHSITVYATDIAGNRGSSDIVYFTVDTVSVSIELLSPENKTYATDSVSLSFAVDEETSWMGYSLDGQANNTIIGYTILIGLSDGMHGLVVYASDMLGNTGSSDTVYFTVDTVLPLIELVSPENKTYAVTDVPLIFTVSEATAWMDYSLDGQMNVTVSGNITLVGLSDGVHIITVYAADTAGNVGRSVSVYFTTNALPPNIELFSPENKTYTTNSVSLRFSVNEPTLWKGYSLDGQANVTIFGDITLSGLSEGSHSLVVYVRDTAGNAGASETVYFAVETHQTEPSQLWIVAIIAIVAGVGFAITGYMAYDLFKRAQK